MTSILLLKILVLHLYNAQKICSLIDASYLYPILLPLAIGTDSAHTEERLC